VARCPECKTKLAPWQTLLPETKSRPLVCRECGTVLRMKPGWLVAIGATVNLVAQFAARPFLHHSRSLGIAVLILVVFVLPVCLYGLFAPAEKVDTLEGNRGAG